VKGEKFPLVIVSHGYPGSRTFLSYLTENLASKGYVVAAIDHTDSAFGDVKGFASTLLNRSNDQLFTIDALAAKAGESDHFLNGLLDASRIAIVGYSMGGYGALASAGGPYSPKGAAFKLVPGGYMQPLTKAKRNPNLKAMVAIAPWGAQGSDGNWDAAGLAGIHVPSLWIVGDRDDVSVYGDGVKKAFDWTTHSERCMLVYQNANHNVGGNPPPVEALGTLETRAFFDEPVWRKDRLTAINQHFITAFLDLYLKGDESRRSYLHVPVEKSNDGVWPDMYWKGFQRRWATGMEMHCVAAQ
jgi:dienelactone hydrolase